MCMWWVVQKITYCFILQALSTFRGVSMSVTGLALAKYKKIFSRKPKGTICSCVGIIPTTVLSFHVDPMDWVEALMLKRQACH